MMSNDPVVCPIARRNVLAALALLLLVLAPVAGWALELDQGWRFRTGDNETWAAPGLDHSAWARIEVGTPWEKAGHKGYDGYAWYRLRIKVPEAMGKQTYVKHYQKLILSLGIVDDVDMIPTSCTPRPGRAATTAPSST